MFINNEGQPDTNRRYRDLAIELRARAPGQWAMGREPWCVMTAT